jgi:hypothetical protein
MTGDKKETDAEKALRYLRRAEGLREIVATMKDAKSQQAILDSAQHHERMAAQLTEKPWR